MFENIMVVDLPKHKRGLRRTSWDCGRIC